ncbi:LytR/AlgR family response regulator transcription factor [Arsenicibacter rosenii]|uniref:HTH LytTR-type domain-containing protein n=1 Tax=Arsenicibacter rosenii TaxID=1750698 RepID=A0A1S2VBY9_9BACT|nr:LytTR family DNA-binding domain-containing protein [Arsenicibacter rosenii]OIN55930.1 hypothetical protein BLX24_27190 [Arsenicibacter rosenii]
MDRVISFKKAEDITHLVSTLKAEHTLIINVNNEKIDVRIITFPRADSSLSGKGSSNNRTNTFKQFIPNNDEFTQPIQSFSILPDKDFRPDLLLLKKGNKNDLITLRNVIYLEADGNYTYICTKEKRYIIKKSLKSLLGSLSEQFQQCHKKYCINIDHLESIQKNTLHLDGDYSVPISKFYKKNFLAFASAYLNVKKY